MRKTVSDMFNVARRIADSATGQRTKVRFATARMPLIGSALVIVMLFSACSPAAQKTNQPVATAAPTATPTIPPPTLVPPTPAAAATQAVTPMNSTPTSAGTAVPTALDPCQLIPSGEASSLAGVTFGDGAEGSVPGGGKTCTYGSQSTNIFYIMVVQAPDDNSAKAAQDQFIADINSNLQQLTSEGLTVSQVPDFADGAVTGSVKVSAGGLTVTGSAFGFRKGTIFFGFSDVTGGGGAPTPEQMQSEATTVLGRLP
jgi:hypothetical protein